MKVVTFHFLVLHIDRTRSYSLSFIIYLVSRNSATFKVSFVCSHMAAESHRGEMHYKWPLHQIKRSFQVNVHLPYLHVMN